MNQRIRKLDPEGTRAAILAAATELFLERGPAAASLRDVADRSGVNKSLIHHHFGSKAGLWGEVKAAVIGGLKAQLEEGLSPSEPDLERLRSVVASTFNFIGNNPGLVRLQGWMALEQDADCVILNEEMSELAIRRLEEAKRKGLLRADVDPRYLYISLWSLCVHFHSNRHVFVQLTGESREELEARYLEHLLAMVLTGVAVLPAGLAIPSGAVAPAG